MSWSDFATKVKEQTLSNEKTQSVGLGSNGK